MPQISIIGNEGKPVLYASLTLEGKLFFEFEYYGRDENEGDYEFNHTVEPEEFPRIASKFGLNPKDPILSLIQQITDMGKGQELERALTKEEIKNELWTWLGTPQNLMSVGVVIIEIAQEGNHLTYSRLPTNRNFIHGGPTGRAAQVHIALGK